MTVVRPLDFSEFSTKSFWIAVYGEFQATMLFILISTGSAMSLNQPTYLHVSLTFGFAVATLIQAVGHISGGHLNPAVSVAMMVTRRITFLRGVLYVAAQMLGAICASAILKGITPDNIAGDLAANKLMNGIDAAQGFAVEMLITFQFIWTVFATTDPERTDPQGSPALAIGISIAIGHLLAIGYTNCGLNPARSFGPAVVSGYWTNHWVFWLGPLVGAVLAGIQYDFILAPTASRQRFKDYMSCDSVPPVTMVNPVHMEMTREAPNTTKE